MLPFPTKFCHLVKFSWNVRLQSVIRYTFIGTDITTTNPKPKTTSSTLFSAQTAAIAFTNLRKFEGTVRLVSVSFFNFIGVEFRTWNPTTKTMSSVPSLVALFWSRFFSNRTSSIQHLFGTVTCFQIKHWYMKHIVVPTFDQQYKATDSSPCYSSYGWRLVSVGLFSLYLSHSLSVVLLFSVPFISWSEYVNAMTVYLN